MSLLTSNQDDGSRHFALSERLSSAAWLSLGFSRAPATEPGKHTKEPPGHELVQLLTRPARNPHNNTPRIPELPSLDVEYSTLTPYLFGDSQPDPLSTLPLVTLSHTHDTYDSVFLRGDNMRVD